MAEQEENQQPKIIGVVRETYIRETVVGPTSTERTLPVSSERVLTEAPQESLTSKIWGLGVRQVVYMALGAALYGGLSYLTNILQLPATSNVSFRPGIVIPLFFGAVFGPWVGLFTGGVGNFLGDYISGYGVYWNWDVGNGLIGLIAGLALYFTWGRYYKVANIVTAEIFGIVAVLVGIGFAAYSDIWVSKYNFAAASGNFVPAALSDLVNGIILLPILLVAYNAATRRMGRG
ncbi:MAG TPA: ECF transporter S component [Ktedonobacteraceae bacterium]|nr:ECF transporter S component [Ktedonobacteraceae bacterium]